MMKLIIEIQTIEDNKNKVKSKLQLIGPNQSHSSIVEKIKSSLEFEEISHMLKVKNI